MIFWILANVAQAIPIIVINARSEHPKLGDVDDSDPGYVEAFAIYMTGLGFLRFGLAAIYILVWKFRYCCLKCYKIKPVDM